MDILQQKINSEGSKQNGDQMGYDAYKSFGPLGVKNSQLRMNNLDLLKSAFAGLKNIGIDVKDVAKAAMTELKKKPRFNPDNLKDIKNY